MTISLNLFDNVKNSDALIAGLGDGVNGTLRNWKHIIKDIGGFWIATADWHGSRSSMTEMYLNGVARRVVESAGGLTTWEGLTADMELTLDGQKYIRTLPACANAVRSIYSTIGDSVFADGSAEDAAWAAVGTPSTRERVTTWCTRGTYGMHVVTDAGDEGVEIENGLTITAAIAYQCHVTVEVISGTWTLAVHNTTGDAVIASRETTGTGRDVILVQIGDNNDATGVYVRLTAAASGAEIYADAAVLQTAPTRAETEWFTDDDAIAEYGRMERVLLEAAMTDATAEAAVKTELADHAWPRGFPPEQFSVMETGGENGLSILFAGYSHTLKWRHVLSYGSGNLSGIVIPGILSEAEFVSAGVIESNSITYQVENDNPLTQWEALEKAARIGDATGARFQCGVYGGRLFDYGPRSTTLDYHYRGGRLLNVHGGEVEPWAVRPGMARLDDMPVGPGQITGDINDDPRNVWICEVEYSAPNGLQFKREPLPGEEPA